MMHEPKFTAMAEVLGELGSEIEALGEVLCRDEDFAARHMRELQAIDLIAQKQRALASLIGAGFSEATGAGLRDAIGGSFSEAVATAGRGAIREWRSVIFAHERGQVSRQI